MIITEAQIIEKFEVCPYCVSIRGTRHACQDCGEAHWEIAYEIEGYADFYLESEVTIVEE